MRRSLAEDGVRLRCGCVTRSSKFAVRRTAFDKLTDIIILCEQCLCLVTPERFIETAAAERSLEQRPARCRQALTA